MSTAVRCRFLLVFGALLLASHAFALPAPDSVSLARLQIQVVQMSKARVLTASSPIEIKKPFVDETGIGSASPRWETIYPKRLLDEKAKPQRSRLER